MPRHIQRSSVGKPVTQPRGEHVFIDQKSPTGLFIRTTMRIGLANIIYNMRRFLSLERIYANA